MKFNEHTDTILNEHMVAYVFEIAFETFDSVRTFYFDNFCSPLGPSIVFPLI